MKIPDPNQPEYYHRVVDCQYACPAHTPVPEYIRLIARGEYTASYLLNRQSNVFPGILGRVCDRPCEPACRRGRVEENPVAICRLKRVASDLKHPDEWKAHLPAIPEIKNGKRVALVGSGPASLTVANDLLPLGYSCDVFERDPVPGGAMRSQVPAFRLPADVLNEEIEVILNGDGCRFVQREITSLSALIEQNYDAIFLGSGAPIAKDLQLPGRREAAAQIHLGLEFLGSVNFGHRKSVGRNVIVIGGGNTAMDCCRTALRIGAEKVTVIAPETYEQMLASAWEKEDAEEEGVEMLNLLLPKEFLHEGGVLTGVRFSQLSSCYDQDMQFRPQPSGKADVDVPCDDVVLAIGQTQSFPFVEKDLPVWQKGQVWVDPVTHQTKLPLVFAGGDAAFGPKNIIWAVAHGHAAATSIHLFCRGMDPTARPSESMELTSQKMGMNLWSYDNGFDPLGRRKVPTRPLKERFEQLSAEVEIGFDASQALAETQRCLNCDIQTVFDGPACIECDACVDICPVDCLTISASRTEEAWRAELKSRESQPPQSIFVSPVPQTDRVMAKDEDICLHCGLCAERCPTGAWDMQQFTLKLPHAKDA